MPDHPKADDATLSRRRALKAAVGTGVAAAAWNAPRIDGLSITPDYAAAQTGAPPPVTNFVIIVDANCNATLPDTDLPNGTTIQFPGTSNLGAGFDWALVDTATLGPPPAGCQVTAMNCDAPVTEDPPLPPYVGANNFTAGTSGSGTFCGTCTGAGAKGSLLIDVTC